MRGPNKQLTAFGRLVAKALVDQGMTKKELAERIGISPQNLSRVLTGTRSGEKYLSAIVAILGLDPTKVGRARAA